VLLTGCGGGTNNSDTANQCPPGYTCESNDASADAAGEAAETMPPAQDATSPTDASADTTSQVDSSAPLDSSRASDSGTPQDAPSQQDASAPGEASTPSDAAAPNDSSGPDDASPPSDAPAHPEAGDTGAPVDAADAGIDSSTTASIVVLGFNVVDARQSAALHSIVTISNNPANVLYIFDETTQVIRGVALPEAPTALGLDPGGLYAAVAYDANVSLIDLTTATLRKTCPLSSNASGVALTGGGIAYVVPATDQWVPLHTLNMSSCAETTNNLIWAGGRIYLHPSGLALFAPQAGDPTRIDRCDITGMTPICTDSQGQNDWGTYGYGDNIWFSADGLRIYTATGVTLRLPASVNGGLATYGGTLVKTTSVVQLAEATGVQQVAFIPGTADSVVQINETNFLGYVRQVTIPPFPLPQGGLTPSHGRFVFTTSSLDTLHVIMRADPSAALAHDYAIASFRP
jgi:hypothetical protein